MLYSKRIGRATLALAAAAACAGCQMNRLTVDAARGGRADPPGTTWHANGREVEVRATPDGGWRLDRWSGDASGSSPSVRVLMDRDKSVRAEFAWDAAGDPPPDLDGWLAARPRLAAVLVWEGRSGPKPWGEWDEGMRAGLRDAFSRSWAGLPSGLPDPPRNAIPQPDWAPLAQGLSAGDMEELYLAWAGHCLAVEAGGRVPWSIEGYGDEELAILLDSRQYARRSLLIPPGGFRLSNDPHCYSLPCPPDVAWAFVRDTVGVGGTRLETVANSLRWCRRMTHFYGKYGPANMEAHWGYRGFPPASRVISGTVNPEREQMGRRHWTGGCHGTSGFLRCVLRAANVPVRHDLVAGHSLTHFPTEGAHLTHGDDPYSAWLANPTGEELLVDHARFLELFSRSSVGAEEQGLNVGIRPREIAIETLPAYLLRQYCEDERAGSPHEGGKVDRGLRNWTAAELEAMGLWERMDAKLQAEHGGMPDNCHHIKD